MIDAIRIDNSRPALSSRHLAILHTAMGIRHALLFGEYRSLHSAAFTANSRVCRCIQRSEVARCEEHPCANVEISPVVKESDPVCHHSTRAQLVGGVSTPTPLVLEVIEAVLGIRPLSVKSRHRQCGPIHWIQRTDQHGSLAAPWGRTLRPGLAHRPTADPEDPGEMGSLLSHRRHGRDFP